MSKKKHYDKSFKQQAVELALTSSQPLSKTAKELGVLETTLYSWVSSAKCQKSPENDREHNDIGKMHEELLKLRKENQRLKDINDILKKATAYFANPHDKDTRS
jgi:transposase